MTHKSSTIGAHLTRIVFEGNLSALMDDGRWLAMHVVVLEGKRWQLNLDVGKLDRDCKLWYFDNKPLCDLEWDPLEVWWQNWVQPN